MGLAYLFFLLVGLGLLVLQAILGSKDADHGGFEKDLHLEAGADAHAEAGADHDADHADHAEHDHGDMGFGGLMALFLQVRFWVFAFLGFGLSGTLLTYLTSVGFLPTLITALALGVVSGFTAALAFKLLKHMAGDHAEDTNQAVGRVGRVIVPVDPSSVGKVRIELRGQSVDLVAKTHGSRIDRGDLVVIEDIEGEIAQVSRAPEELKIADS
jgi:membrane protein implicated in regulation of membrane protease activity